MSELYCFRRASFFEFLSDLEAVVSLLTAFRSETYFSTMGLALASCALVRVTCFLRSAKRSSADSGACLPLPIVVATDGEGEGLAAWVMEGSEATAIATKAMVTLLRGVIFIQT